MNYLVSVVICPEKTQYCDDGDDTKMFLLNLVFTEILANINASIGFSYMEEFRTFQCPKFWPTFSFLFSVFIPPEKPWVLIESSA
jgi:hypothetical protein